MDWLTIAHKRIAQFGYKEIFLDQTAGTYSRNLFDDISTIPDFNVFDPNNKIALINLSVDEHGSAIFDNIRIGTDFHEGWENAPLGTFKPVSVE